MQGVTQALLNTVHLDRLRQACTMTTPLNRAKAMPMQEQTMTRKALLCEPSLNMRSTKPKPLSTTGASRIAPAILAACKIRYAHSPSPDRDLQPSCRFRTCKQSCSTVQLKAEHADLGELAACPCQTEDLHELPSRCCQAKPCTPAIALQDQPAHTVAPLIGSPAGAVKLPALL